MRLGGNPRVSFAPGTTLMSDPFTDTNGVNLSAHALAVPVGGSWTITLGGLTIQTNRAMAGAGGGGMTAQGSASDCRATVIVNLAAGGTAGAGLMLRSTDATHYWWVLIDDAVDEVAIYETSGSSVKRASGAFVPTPGVDYTLRVDMVGTTITAFVDGVQKASYASATFNQFATRHGVLAAEADVFDTFLVTAL